MKFIKLIDIEGTECRLNMAHVITYFEAIDEDSGELITRIALTTDVMDIKGGCEQLDEAVFGKVDKPETMKVTLQNFHTRQEAERMLDKMKDDYPADELLIEWRSTEGYVVYYEVERTATQPKRLSAGTGRIVVGESFSTREQAESYRNKLQFERDEDLQVGTNAIGRFIIYYTV